MINEAKDYNIKRYKANLKKSKVEVEYEIDQKPVTFEIDFSFKVKPEWDKINKSFDDFDDFYYAWLKKSFTERKFAEKLNNFKMSGYDVDFVTFNTDFDASSINKNTKSLNFRINVSISAKDESEDVDRKQFQSLMDANVKKIESALLADEDYLKYTK